MVEVDAPSVSIPRQPSDIPRSCRSQSMTSSSSSVADGDVRHNIPFTFRAAVSASPRIPGPDPVIAK